MSATDKLILHTDGGSRGNPGPASAAAVLTIPDTGVEVFAGGFFLGKTTNNVAEYQGLIKGLEQAVKIGTSEIFIFTDSELMTRQITGVYKVKNAGLKPLYEQVLNLQAKFKRFEITHVRRMHNKRADELVNMSLDVGRDIIDTSGGIDVPDDCNQVTADTEKFSANAVRLIARCVSGSKCDCPAEVDKSLVLDLPGVTTEGNCMFAVAGIVNAYLASDGTDSFEAKCSAPGCGAKFQVAVNKL